MEVTWIYLLSLYVYVSWNGILAVSERYFMEDECGRTVDMQTADLESIRLELTKFEKYHRNYDCMLRLHAPPGKRLQVIVDINEIEWSVNCTKDYLQLFDGPALNGKLVTGADPRICSSSHVLSSYTTTDRYLTVRFKSDSEESWDGFKLLITAFRVDTNCYKTEFRCHRNDRCISEQLVCNRFRDCPDSSDECELSTAAVIGIAVSSVIIVMSTVGIVVCLCCLRKRRKETGSTRRLGSDVTDNPSSKVYQTEKADIHYYRPKTVSVENVYSTLPHMSHSSSGNYVLTGPHPTSYTPETQQARQKWITVPPTTLQDAEGNYFSPYGH